MCCSPHYSKIHIRNCYPKHVKFSMGHPVYVSNENDIFIFIKHNVNFFSISIIRIKVTGLSGKADSHWRCIGLIETSSLTICVFRFAFLLFRSVRLDHETSVAIRQDVALSFRFRVLVNLGVAKKTPVSYIKNYQSNGIASRSKRVFFLSVAVFGGEWTPRQASPKIARGRYNVHSLVRNATVDRGDRPCIVT